MEECKISIRLAKEKMRLTRPIYDFGKVLLLPIGAVLTSKMIVQLKFYGIKEIWIEDHTMIEKEEQPVEALPRYIERIKASEAFARFEHAHMQSVEEVKDALNGLILKNREVDAKRLLHEVDHILQGIQNGMQVFDMLQCMKTYDDSTYVHSVNVALICNVMGRWLELEESEIEVLTLCGLLHDVGKLMLPPEIIKKAGKLTPTEFVTVQTHPQIGYGILEYEKLDERIKKAALQHHEKCDGSGYPNKLQGSELDEFAKIVTIADVYDAMTADRVYRQGICPFDVIEIFEQEGLQKYEPRYLLTFLKHMAESYINQTVQLSNAQEGQIIMLNQHALSKPVVKVQETYVDLSKEREITIQRIL